MHCTVFEHRRDLGAATLLAACGASSQAPPESTGGDVTLKSLSVMAGGNQLLSLVLDVMTYARG